MGVEMGLNLQANDAQMTRGHKESKVHENLRSQWPGISGIFVEQDIVPRWYDESRNDKDIFYRRGLNSRSYNPYIECEDVECRLLVYAASNELKVALAVRNERTRCNLHLNIDG
jgi:hypothetical protein